MLDVYHRPYDPARPQVCLVETSKQLVEHTRVPIAPSRGKLARVDDEYKRCGTANIFAAIEPLTGRGLVEPTAHRTAVDMARFLRRLSDEAYREAETIVLVMDDLNNHDLSCLCEAFEPAQARRLVQRLEVRNESKRATRRRGTPQLDPGDLLGPMPAPGAMPFKNLNRSLSVERTRVVSLVMIDLWFSEGFSGWPARQTE